MKNKLDIKTAVADYAIMLAGAAVYATSVVVFTAPNDIAPGGLTGVATMLNHMFGLPIGRFYGVSYEHSFVYMGRC